MENRRITLCLCLFFTTILLFSCKKDREDELPNPDFFSPLQSKSDLRSGQGANPYRFLGKGFDLTSYASYDVLGITPQSILDHKRMEENNPWNPFGNDPEYRNRLAPEPVVISFTSTEGWNMGWLEYLSDMSKDNEMSVDIGAGYKAFALSYKHDKKLNKKENLHSYRSYRYKVEAKVEYKTDGIRDYTSYLSRRFVASLKNMEAAELVSRYGTHIITSYKLGPYYDMIVSTRKVFFTKDETQALASNLVVSDNTKLDLGLSLKEKLEKYSQHTSIILRQGGSLYTPHTSLLRFNGSYSAASVVPFDEGEWHKMVKLGDNNFMELSKEVDKLVAIPSLITDIPLKVKYMSGIIDKMRENENAGKVPSSTNYILCSPTTYEPLKLNDDLVYIALPRFRSDRWCELKLKTPFGKSIVEALETKGIGNNWDVSLNRDGLWTITQQTGTGKKIYLCNDYKVREEKDINAEQILWLFNPIITKEGETGAGTFNLFIQRQ